MSEQSLVALLENPSADILLSMASLMNSERSEEDETKSPYVLPSEIITLAPAQVLNVNVQMMKQSNFLISSFGITQTIASSFAFNMRVSGELEYLFNDDVWVLPLEVTAIPVTVNPPMLIKGGSGIELRLVARTQNIIQIQFAFFGYLVPKGEFK